jgi:hypothetical protein
VIRRVRMARKRLAISNERIWAAWFSALQPPPSTNKPEEDPTYQRKLKQFRAIERRKDRTC